MYNQPTYSRSKQRNTNLDLLLKDFSSKSSFYVKTLPPLPSIDWKPSKSQNDKTKRNEKTKPKCSPSKQDELKKFYQEKSDFFKNIENFELTTISRKRKVENQKVPSTTSEYFGTCPPEIINTILSFIDSSTDLCSIACVSKQWLYLSSSNTIWQPLYIQNFNYPEISQSTPSKKSNWKALFLKRRKEIVVKKIHAYGKKTKLTTNFEFGFSDTPVTYPSALSEDTHSFKIPSKKAKKPRKKQTKQETSQNDQNEVELMHFLQKKKQFYDSFDNVSLQTTPAKR